MRRRTLLFLGLALLVTWLASRDSSYHDPSPASPRSGRERPAAARPPDDATAPARANPGASPARTETGTGILLAGRVTLEPEGTPARYALVRMVPDADGSDDPVAEVLTESDGTFRMEDAPAGTFRLHVWAPDRVEYSDPELALVAGEDRTDLRIGLIRGGTIFGTVAGRRGTPVFRRVVSAKRETGGEARGETDFEGGYEFSNLPPGRWRVGTEGWPEEWVDLADGESVRRDFTTPEPATLTVALVDPAGAPVRGRVMLRRPGEPWEDDGFFSGTGPCVFEGIEPGAREIWAEGQARAITLAEGERRTETFRFEPASLGGRAVFEGPPYSRAAWVELIRLDAPGVEPFGRRWRTEPDGTFRLEGVLPGEYELLAGEGEAESRPIAMTLRGSESRLNLELRILEPRVVVVRLIDRKGESPAFVVYSLFRGDRWVASGDSDSRGRAEIVAVPGRYTLKLYPEGADECAAEREIEVLATDRNEFEIELR